MVNQNHEIHLQYLNDLANKVFSKFAVIFLFPTAEKNIQ